MAALVSPPRLSRLRPLPTNGRRQTRVRDRVQTAMAFITSDERDVLELCFSAGCPAAEISRKLQIPLGAIKAQLDRGLFGFVHALGLQHPHLEGNFRPTFMNQTIQPHAGGKYPSVFSDYRTFLEVAQTFEGTGVKAYKGQPANLITSSKLLSAALRIHFVEARHAAEIRRLRRVKPWDRRVRRDFEQRGSPRDGFAFYPPTGVVARARL